MVVSDSISLVSNSSSASSNSTTLGVLAKKLAHDLEEIRERSLDQLESKLDNNLLSEDDLILNRDLIVKLLDLLSSPDMTRHHEKTARIMLKLMKWPSAVKSLLLLNGLEILEKLRQEMKSSSTLHETIESIIDILTEKFNELGDGNLSSSNSVDLFDRIARFQIQSRLACHTNSLESYDSTLLAASSDCSKNDRVDSSSFEAAKSNKVHKVIVK